MNLAPLADAAVTGAAGAIAALVALLIPRIPLLVTWLRVSVEGSDATRLRYAIANAAEVAMRAVEGGQPQDRAVDEMVAYCRANMPRLIARLAVPDTTLLTMCEAALARLMAGRR